MTPQTPSLKEVAIGRTIDEAFQLGVEHERQDWYPYNADDKSTWPPSPDFYLVQRLSGEPDVVYWEQIDREIWGSFYGITHWKPIYLPKKK